MGKQVRILTLSSPSYVTPVHLYLSEPQVSQLLRGYKSWCSSPAHVRTNCGHMCPFLGPTMGSRKTMLTTQNQEARWLSQGSTQDGPQGGPNVLHEQEDA